jgi:hypothetical protein
MTSERSGDAELRRLLHQRGDEIVVDVEAGLRAVERAASRKRHTRRLVGGVLTAAAAVVAVALGGTLIVTQHGRSSSVISHPARPALPDGTYRYRLTARELRAASGGHISQQDIRNNAGIWTWKVHDGRWSLHLNPSAPEAAPPYPCSGTLALRKNVATFVRTVNLDPSGDCVPPTWTARYTFERGVALWSDVSVADFGWFFAADPWVLH